MKIVKTLLLVISLAVFTFQFNFFSIETLNNKTGAVCLDGSPAAIYTYQPDVTKPPNKLLIFFQSSPNGWCFGEDLSTSLEECHKWSTNEFGSSTHYQSNFLPMAGMLSAQPLGELANWYKVLIKSCDGGSYLGNRQPVLYKKQKIYFRGSKIIQETINLLNKKGWLQNRDEVVLVGAFNGGVAAVLWSSTFQKYTKNPIRVIADSAYFLNEINEKHNRPTIENRMKSVAKLVFENLTLPYQQCSNAFVNEEWKCLFMENLVPITNFPIFFTQSLYDSFHIQEVLGYQCAEIFKSLSECPAKDKEVIDSYKKKIESKLQEAGKIEKNGVFAIACALHDMSGGKYTNDIFEVPMKSGNMLYKAIESWNNGEKIVWIDSIEWPNNTPCAHKLAGKSSWLRYQ